MEFLSNCESISQIVVFLILIIFIFSFAFVSDVILKKYFRIIVKKRYLLFGFFGFVALIFWYTGIFPLDSFSFWCGYKGN